LEEHSVGEWRPPANFASKWTTFSDWRHDKTPFNFNPLRVANVRPTPTDLSNRGTIGAVGDKAQFCKAKFERFIANAEKALIQLVDRYRAILLDGAQPIALGPMTRGLKWSRGQVEVWVVNIRRAYMDEWVHSYMPLYIICGQNLGI
jgi:hypothetical protein